jgi:hypothetical protein
MSLNPAENAAKQAQAQADAAGPDPEDQPLDPAFPYIVIKCDPTVFGSVADKATQV